MAYTDFDFVFDSVTKYRKEDRDGFDLVNVNHSFIVEVQDFEVVEENDQMFFKCNIEYKNMPTWINQNDVQKDVEDYINRMINIACLNYSSEV